MKVYVITKGEYSDYHICAVATDDKIAEDLRKKFSTGCYEATIEEYDTEYFQEILRFKNTYVCWLYESDNHIKVVEADPDTWHQRTVGTFKDGLYVEVNADNEQDALKFASDKFAKYKAEKLGL